MLGPVLGRLGRASANSRIGQAMGRAASQAVTAVRNGIRRTGQFIKNRFDQFGSKAVSFKPGWSKEKITAIPKGQRPHPSDYLSDEYVSKHLDHFDTEGSSFIIDKGIIESGSYKTLPPRKYAMSKPDMDRAVDKYKKTGKVEDLEDALGYDRGSLAGRENELYLATAKKGKLKYDMPNGNERGANDHWEPGGRTSGGKREAVFDSAEIGTDGKPVVINHDNDI